MNGHFDPENMNHPRSAGSPSSENGHRRAPAQGRPSAPTGEHPRPQHRPGGPAADGHGQHHPHPQGQRPHPHNGEHGEKRPAPPQGEEKKLGRNFILATILLFLVLLTALIFGIQSCTHKPHEDEYHGDDDVILNTPDTEETDTALASVYARYTEDTDYLSMASQYGILIDLDTNTVVAHKGGDQKIYPASMTKVMTLIVAYESISDLDNTTYTFGYEMLNELSNAGASRAGFEVGETVCARDLLYGAILPSGGDATNALAELVAGSEEHFAVLMNEKVKELGLENTHFVTASGLHHDDHYSTCHDIAKILQYAISNPGMREILSTYQYTTKPTEHHPEGILLTSTMYKKMAGDEVEGFYVQGGKTGYTIEAKNCLASFGANCHEHESLTVKPQYILVTAFAGGEYTPVYDAIDIYKKYCAE